MLTVSGRFWATASEYGLICLSVSYECLTWLIKLYCKSNKCTSVIRNTTTIKNPRRIWRGTLPPKPTPWLTHLIYLGHMRLKLWNMVGAMRLRDTGSPKSCSNNNLPSLSNGKSMKARKRKITLFSDASPQDRKLVNWGRMCGLWWRLKELYVGLKRRVNFTSFSEAQVQW